MELYKVARRFDRSPMWDAYTGVRLPQKCQMTVWDSPRRDGLTTIRRTISVAPETVMPKRGTLYIGGAYWIISRLANPDTWGNHNIRTGYVAQMATLGRVANTDELLSDGSKPVFMSRTWVKDVKDITVTSEAQGQYYIYFPQGENLQEGEFAFIDNRWHIIRNIITGTAGLMIAECNELEVDAVVEVSIRTQGKYNPVTETYEEGEELKFKAVRMAWRDDYKHGLPTREAEQIGDIRLRIRAEDSGFVSRNTRLEIDGVTWQVADIEPRNSGAVSAVLRRV